MTYQSKAVKGYISNFYARNNAQRAKFRQQCDSPGKDSLNAEGVLYDLKKLQKSLFNQKRKKDVDPVLVQRHA